MFVVYSSNTKINKKKLINNILFINDWEKKYLYISKLGKFLFKMPRNLIINNNLVHYCNSNSWIDFKIINNKYIILYAYSKSLIIKGLISIVLLIFNKYKLINKINNNSYINIIKKKVKLKKDKNLNINNLLYIEKIIINKLNFILKSNKN